MMRPFTSRFRRGRVRRSRVARAATGGAVALTLLAGTGTFAAANPVSGGQGNAQVGTSNPDGLLLATDQRVKPIGQRYLLTNGRIMSSVVSPNGKYIALLSWYNFTGFLTIVNLSNGSIVQQVGAPGTPQLGDGTVAADGPLWSPKGDTLWVPQTYDLVRFSASANGTVSNPVVIPLATAVNNLNGGTTNEADEPSGMALSPDGSKLYVALNGVNQLGVIDTATNQLVRQIAVGNSPRQVVLVGDRAFVSNEGGRLPQPGDFTNVSGNNQVVASPVTGAATTGTVSVVSLTQNRETTEIPVGLQPTALYLAEDGTLFVANSNDDSMSLINTGRDQVVQTVNVNPLPGSTVGSYPNAITMPDAHTVLVSIGRDNALGVFGYDGAANPLLYEGLLPTDAYPVGVTLDPALHRVVVSNDRGIGTFGPETSIDKGPGTSPAPETVTGHNTYDDTSSITEFQMPPLSALGRYTAQVFVDNDWEHLLLAQSQTPPKAAPVPIPTQLGQPSTIKHVFLIVRENRTFDQVFGDLTNGANADPALAQFGEKITPNAHALETTFGTFDNFYDPSTLSADGHNWIVQADANDYLEKEFGAFYRSYPASGGDALAYQRDGFLWNTVEAAGKTAQDFGEYNNYFTQPSPAPTWSQYFADSQVLQGQAPGPLPVPLSSIHTYSDIPSLNQIDYPEYPPFDLGIPDQYRADVFLQAFQHSENTGQLADFTMIWLPDDHTGGSTNPYPVAQVADNDLALGRIVDAISHSKFWPSSAIFVEEDDSQNGTDHVDGHRAPLLIISPWAKRGIVDHTYYNQVSVTRTIEQILGAAPMNQMDRAAEPMYNAFTDTPNDAPYNSVPNQVCLNYGPAAPFSPVEDCPAGGVAPTGTANANAQPAPAAAPAYLPASQRQVFEQWMVWQQDQRFSGPGAVEDWANPAQLNRYDWYSAHDWNPADPYPGDATILAPGQVPGAEAPAGYLVDN
jgi:YVTN family beta-propeller protein